MGEASIEQLDIELTSSVSGADKAVDRMIERFEQLSQVMNHVDADKFFKAASGMSDLAYAVQGFANVKAADFNRVAKGIEKLGQANFGNIANTAKSLAEMAEPLKNFTAIDLGKAIDVSRSKTTNKAIEDQTDAIDALYEKYKTAGTDANVALPYDIIWKEANKATLQVDRLNAKIENYIASGRNINSKGFESLVQQVQYATNRLDKLNARMDILRENSDNVGIVGMGFEKPSTNAEAQTKSQDALTASTQQTAQAMDDVANTAERVKNTQAQTDAILSHQRFSERNIEQEIEDIANQAAKAKVGIESLVGKFMPSSLGKGEKFTQDYIDLSKAIDKADSQLERLYARQAKMNALGVKTDSSAWKSLQYDIEGAVKKLNQLFLEMSKLQSEGGDKVFVGLAHKAKSAGKQVDYLGKMMKSLNGASKKMKSAIANATKGLHNFFKAFQTRLMRMAIQQMIRLAQQGFQNIAQGSQKANAVLSQFSSNVTYLKNSFAAAFTPLLAIVEPVLTKITDLLVQATNAVGMFFSAIAGFGVFVKAKRVQDDYAKSLGGAAGAAKKLENATTGIDELNIIQDNANNGGGGGAGKIDPNSMFEEVDIPDNIKKIAEAMKTDDWSILGETLAKKLNDAMRNIDWTGIQAEAQRIAHGIGTAINGFVNDLDWTLLGKTVGEGINTGLIFADELLTTVQWENIGRKFAEGANSIVDTVQWDLLGQTVADGINVVLDTGFGFLEDFDFENLGSSLATSMNTLFDGIHWDEIGGILSDGISGAFKAFYGFFDNFDVSKVYTGIRSAFSGIKWDEVAQAMAHALGTAIKVYLDIHKALVENLAIALVKIKDYFSEKFEEVGGNIPKGIMKGIMDGLQGIVDWIRTNIFLPFWDGVKGAFGIHSPSTEMATLGGFVSEGFLNGIIEGLKNIPDWIKAHIFDPFWDGIKSVFGIEGDTASTTSEAGTASVNGFKDGIDKEEPGLLERITTFAGGVVDRFGKGKNGNIANDFKGFGSDVTTGFRDSVVAKKGTALTEIGTWAKETNSNFTTVANAKTFEEHAQDMITGMKTKIDTGHSQTQNPMETWAKHDNTWFTNIASKTAYSGFGQDTITAFGTKITNKHDDTQKPMETWAKNDNKWFTEIASKKAYQGFASDTISAFGTEVSTNHSRSNTAMTGWANDTINAFEKPNGTSIVEKFKNIGKHLINGFIEGAQSMMQNAIDAVSDFASDVIDMVEDVFDINSPSRVFRQIGVYTIEGFNEGIEDTTKYTTRVMEKWAQNVKSVDVGLNFSTNMDSVKSQMKNFRANYGQDMAIDSVIRNVATQQNVNRSYMETSFSTESMQSAITAAVRSEILPVLQQSNEYARITSEKTMSANVRIGNKVVASAVEEQRARNGFSFTS